MTEKIDPPKIRAPRIGTYLLHGTNDEESMDEASLRQKSVRSAFGLKREQRSDRFVARQSPNRFQLMKLTLRNLAAALTILTFGACGAPAENERGDDGTSPGPNGGAIGTGSAADRPDPDQLGATVGARRSAIALE